MLERKWSLSMHQIETCGCSHGCGCQFSGYPDSETGGCEALLGFYVKSGHLDNIDLSDVKIVFAAAWPKAIHEGNGSGILYIDEAASAEQVAAIATIFSGEMGGMPFEALAGTFSAFEGPLTAKINMEVNGRNSSFSIDNVLSVQETALINPVTGEEQNVHIGFPDGGFFWQDGEIGTTTVMQINHDKMSFDHVGGFAAKAEVQWQN